MTRRNLTTFIIILLLFAAAVYSLVQPVFGREDLRLGLDLVGGVHLVYQAEFPEGATAEEKAQNMERALATIQSRIDKYGIAEPVIQQQGDDRILVQLPGFTDIEEAKRLVEQTGFLEFRQAELNDDGNPVYLGDYLDSAELKFFDETEPGSRIFVDAANSPVAILVSDGEGNLSFTDGKGNPVSIEELRQATEEMEAGSAVLLSWIPARGDDGTQLTGSFLAMAAPGIINQTTGVEAEVDIEWTEEGGIIFDQIASRLYNAGAYGTPQRALGIFLDNTLLSYPQILQPAYDGKGAITGNFTVEEVERLANLLESGALPMPLQKPPLYEETVSATLGGDFVEKSIMAGVVGIMLVMLFMIVYYRLPGALASLSLIFYGVLVLAIFKLIPVTMTLAGIGGFVLSIGMAVDANVLIFERMKEEMRAGRTLGAAVEAGSSRAWTAIRDSNLTTFIVCGILYWLGSSVVASAPVMGFALTLFVGVAVSMFTAVIVTRTLLRLFVGTAWAKRTSLFSVYTGRE